MIDVSICVGSSCHLRGSYPIIEELKRLIAQENKESDIDLKASFCTGECVNGVCVSVGDEKIKNVTPQNIKEVFYEKILPAVK